MSQKEISSRCLTLFVISVLSFASAASAGNMSEEAIAQRIAPVGSVYLQGDIPEIETFDIPSGPRSGDNVYNTFCIACHSTGIAGAPKAGDKKAWNVRMEQGREVLNDHAINGFNAMPARGTCMDCTNEEMIAAIDHILSL